ncbi:lactadherin-like [Amphiura filiformis]|uniref:lactadherin-like n=1 Tax=Amphiura filiformis TaxID=82378 RepID=UPI003B2171B0
MENGFIRNEQIKGSDFTYGHFPQEGRLNSYKYWKTEYPSPADPWIQVDLKDNVTITRIRTQGSVSGWYIEHDHWVSKLQIQYGNTEDSLAYIMDGSAPKTFNANSDRDTVVSITFPQPISARFLRIIPTEWHTWVALRFEVIGCDPDCNTALGMESGFILDNHITAADYYTADGLIPDDQRPADGRLHQRPYCWVSTFSNPYDDPWIQVAFKAFENTVNITGIQTQGSGPSIWHSWVTKLQIQYGNTEDSLAYIMDGATAKTFNANSDEDTVVSITFPQPISAMFLRIITREWHRWVTLRFEVIGCHN